MANATGPDQAIATWLRSELGASRVEVREVLAGSTTATILGCIAHHGDAPHEIVVKRYDRTLPEDEARRSVVDEAAGLELAARSGLPVPRLLALDANGSRTGRPSVAMSRLAGRPVLTGGAAWTKGLARTLAAIAATSIDVSLLRDASSWCERGGERPNWFTDEELWSAMKERFDAGLVGSAPTFLHRDFHTLNVLWHEGRVSGVVDWVHACRGPVEIDVSRCRVNIALTSGIEAADAFVRCCGDLGLAYDTAWDLETLLPFMDDPDVLLTGNDLGAGLTPDGIRSTLIELSRGAVDAG